MIKQLNISQRVKVGGGGEKRKEKKAQETHIDAETHKFTLRSSRKT